MIGIKTRMGVLLLTICGAVLIGLNLEVEPISIIFGILGMVFLFYGGYFKGRAERF